MMKLRTCVLLAIAILISFRDEAESKPTEIERRLKRAMEAWWHDINTDDVNECDSNPCLNGATCLDQVNKYKCQCKPGYQGIRCEVDFNECASNPCLNGATCLDQVNKYTCQCKPGYQGIRCEVDFNECASNPCQNGAT